MWCEGVWCVWCLCACFKGMKMSFMVFVVIETTTDAEAKPEDTGS